MSSKKNRIIVTGISLVILYSFSVYLNGQYAKTTEENPSGNYGLWNFPEKVLLAISLEFKGLLADYLTLEGGAALGTELRRNPEGGYLVVEKTYDWQNIIKIFRSSQVLDPSFEQTYLVVQGWFPWEPVNMVSETQAFLKITAQNRPWDWRPLHTMGFNAYYHLNDRGKAGTLFLKAAQTPNAPSFLAVLGGRLAHEGGKTEDAIILMKSMLNGKTSDDNNYKDIIDRLRALEGVLKIEKAVEKFQSGQGRQPESVEELINFKYLEKMPENPYSVKFCMDTEGKIYFDNPECNE